jgi:hypothetical protein
VRRLKDALDSEGILSKERCSQSGRISGGQPLSRGALYRMLSNRLYLGEIVHRGECYAGQHDAIVDQGLWDQTQTLLTTNRVGQKNGDTARDPSLLAGLLYDDHGTPMTPSHAIKDEKRYRYYISRPLTIQVRKHAPTGRRIPAGDIEQLVVNRIRCTLADESSVLEAIQPDAQDAAAQKQLLACAQDLSRGWDELAAPQVRALLCALIARIDVLSKNIEIHLIRSRVAEVLLNGSQELPPASACGTKSDRVVLSVSAELRRVGMGTKLIIDANDTHGRKAKPDASLVKLIIKAHALHEKLLNNGGASLATIARQEGLTGSYMTRVVRLSFLSPDITRAILDGCHPPDLTAAKLTRLSQLPLDWDQQKTVLGCA